MQRAAGHSRILACKKRPNAIDKAIFTKYDRRKAETLSAWEQRKEA